MKRDDSLHLVEVVPAPDRLVCETWPASDQAALLHFIARVDEVVTELSDSCPWKWALIGIRRHVAETVGEPRVQVSWRSGRA